MKNRKCLFVLMGLIALLSLVVVSPVSGAVKM